MARTITLVVPEEVVAEAKIKAVRESVSLSAVVRAWFTAWAAGDLDTPEGAKEEGKDAPDYQAKAELVS